MPLPSTILLAADHSLIRSLIHEILETHGYEVLVEESGSTSLVTGHSFPGKIHLLIADIDHGGRGQGPEWADNLAYGRPDMPILFFGEESGNLWLLNNPEAFETDRTPFTPGNFLEGVAGILSGSLSAQA